MSSAAELLHSRESPAFLRSLWSRPLICWHLLSLDAPTVSALWAIFFARAMRLELPWHAPLLLAMGTWLIYVSDRILDGLRPGCTIRLELRHRFHHRHRGAFLKAGIAVSGALAWLVLTRMSPEARFEDFILFVVALCYLLLVHRGRQTSWLPKELAVGLVFAAASGVPAWARLSSGRAALLPMVLLFAALCWLNCVAIELWETPRSLSSPPNHLAGLHLTTRWTARYFRSSALVLSLAAGTLATRKFLIAAPPHTDLGVYAAVVMSAIALALIDVARSRLSASALRIGADLTLLTPLLFLPFL